MNKRQVTKKRLLRPSVYTLGSIMRSFRLTSKSVTLKDLKLKPETWDKAQRKATRRRKSDWVKSLGGGWVEIPTLAKLRGPN